MNSLLRAMVVVAVLTAACSSARESRNPDNGDGCYDCHGAISNGNNAPPPAFWRTEPVGDVHQSHLGTSSWHREIACADCHVVPTAVLDEGHVDSALPAEVTWSGISNIDGASPVLDTQTMSCSGTYCHGTTLLVGGRETTPSWTDTDGSASQCGSCHSLPPEGDHPVATDCNSCHGEVIAADNTSFVAPELHIDGIVQRERVHEDGWQAPDQHGDFANASGLDSCMDCHGPTLDGDTGPSCDSCHSGWKTNCIFCHGGTDNLTGAPPEGVFGELARTDRSVGAHTSHVEDTLVHSGRPCTTCHIMPTSALSPGHIDGDARAEVVFDVLNPLASYDLGTNGCNSLYCHGNGWNSTAAMVWNVNPTLTCSSCHNDETVNNFAMSGQHKKHVIDQGIACVACHANVVDGQKRITTLGLHVDGKPDVSLQSGGIWNANNRSCTPVCHNNKTW